MKFYLEFENYYNCDYTFSLFNFYILLRFDFSVIFRTSRFTFIPLEGWQRVFETFDNDKVERK